jgi:hypothetical protein
MRRRAAKHRLIDIASIKAIQRQDSTIWLDDGICCVQDVAPASKKTDYRLGGEDDRAD